VGMGPRQLGPCIGLVWGIGFFSGSCDCSGCKSPQDWTPRLLLPVAQLEAVQWANPLGGMVCVGPYTSGTF